MSNYPLILQLDKAGQPKKWIDYEKAAYYYCKDMIAWDYGVNYTKLYGGINRVLNQQSTLTVNSIIAIKGKVGKKERSPSLNNNVLFRRDGRRCAYCHEFFAIKDLTRDHVTAKTHGGPNTWQNVVTSCKKCNSHKGDKTIEDMASHGWKLHYKPYIPCYTECLFLNNLAMTDDQYKYLIALIPAHSRVHQYYTREL